MTTQNQQPADTVARADHDAAITAARTEAHAEGRTEGHAAGRTEGEAAGRTAAIDRVRAILTAPEAKGREPQALVFALDSDMTPKSRSRRCRPARRRTRGRRWMRAVAIRFRAVRHPIPKSTPTALGIARFRARARSFPRN